MKKKIICYWYDTNKVIEETQVEFIHRVLKKNKITFIDIRKLKEHNIEVIRDIKNNIITIKRNGEIIGKSNIEKISYTIDEQNVISAEILFVESMKDGGKN